MEISSEKQMLRLVDPGDEGSAVARSYRDGTLVKVVWNAGELREMIPVSEGDAGGLWIAPGLFDLQVNGYAGVDFQRPCDGESLRRAADGLRRDGCARALLTLITRPWDDMLAKIAALRTVIHGDPLLERTFPGWHIEGPFLSAQPGFCGAHNPVWMRDPSVADVLALKHCVGDDPVLLTMAPERIGAGEAIAQAVACGFVVSFGHTNAGASDLRAGCAAGGRAFTHLGNGCPQSLDRHDNIIWNVLDESGLIAGLIPDGTHVPPPVFRSLHRALGPSRVYWTTDAMAAAGAGEGSYTLGESVVNVGPDRIVRHPVTGGFAGSALEPIEGIRRGAGMLGARWQDVWDFFSLQPARLLNLGEEWGPGTAAGFCLLREGLDG